MSFLSFGRVKTAAMQTIAGTSMPIAIDFGVSSLKVLQLQAGDPPQLIAAGVVETPDALVHDHAKRFEFQCQALPRLIKAGRFKGKRAVCAIPAGHMYCKHMQFPRSDGVSLESLVQTALPQALNAPPEALVLRHFPVEGAQCPGSTGAGQTTGGVKQEVICLAVSREMVERLMASIRNAKLEPVGIHPECVATIRAFDHINRRASDDHLTTLYLDVGFGATKVWITQGRSMVFAKVIQFGGRDLDHVVSRALELRPAEARAKRLSVSALIAPAAMPKNAATLSADSPAKQQAEHSFLTAIGASQAGGQTPSAAVAEDRRSGQLAPGLTPSVLAQEQAAIAPPEFDLQIPLENLTDEVGMCLRYYEAMFPGRRIDRAVFFGGEARHRGLCQIIAKRCRCPAHVADPVARMARTGKEPVLGVDFSSPQPGWTVAFGLSHCPTDL